MDTPHFTHNCRRCVPLGDVRIAGQVIDLYYCPGEPTLVARFSSDGPDYSSGLVFGEKRLIPALTVAYDRAVARGFLPPRPEPPKGG